MMTEAIDILEKQIQNVRNKLAGTQARIETLSKEEESATEVLEILKRREILLNSAIVKLRE